MANVLVPTSFQNWPNAPKYAVQEYDWLHLSEVADWTWSVSGHSAPSALTQAANGEIVLGSGSATDNAYVSGQALTESVRLNILGATYRMLFRVKLSDATQLDSIVGLCITNTNTINTAIADGIFFRKDDGDTNWDACIAFDASTAPDDYTQTNAVATATTSYVTLGIQIVLDTATLGTGNVTYFVDGTQVTSIATTGLPHDEELRLTVAVQNGEAVAKTLTMDYAGVLMQRVA